MPLEVTVGPSGTEGATESPVEQRAPHGVSPDANSPAGSNRQWMRRCQLILGGSGGGLDVSNLRIRFAVKQADIQTPAHADIRIYNLSAETANQIQNEFDKVELKVGYKGTQLKTIFKGEIKQKRKGRENPVDTFSDILAVNSDKAYNYATVNKTLPAGSTYKDHVDEALKALKKFGVTEGYIADLGQHKHPRARVLFGMARDVLRTVAFATKTSWSIQNDVFQMVKNEDAAPGDTIVLNSRTGMVGLPVQTIDGIEVRCLLNPSIVPGRKVKIDESSIQQQRLNPAYGAEVANNMIPSLADDGVYKVLVVEHIGDTRGQPWYSELICLRADGKGGLGSQYTYRYIDLFGN